MKRLLCLLILAGCATEAHAIGGYLDRCMVSRSDLAADRVGMDVRKITGVSRKTLTYQTYRGLTPIGAPATMQTGELYQWRQVPCPKRNKAGALIERGYEKRTRKNNHRHHRRASHVTDPPP